MIGLLSGFAPLFASSTSEQVAAELVTEYSQTLDSKALESGFTLYPALAVSFPSRTSLTLDSVIYRPTDKYKNVEVPKTVVGLKQNLVTFLGTDLLVDTAITAQEFHRWAHEGFMVRNSVGLSLERPFESGFKVAIRTAPFYQWNEYRQTTGGNTKSQYGISEKLIVSFLTGRTTLRLTLVTTQRYTNVWKNDYSTEELVAYDLDDTWFIGASHSLLGATVDESTGRFSDLKIFDDRKSLIAAFVGIKL